MDHFCALSSALLIYLLSTHLQYHNVLIPAAYIVGLNIRKSNFSHLLFLFSKLFWLFYGHSFSRGILEQVCLFPQKNKTKTNNADTLIRMTLNLRSIWRRTNIFNMVNLPIHEPGISLCIQVIFDFFHWHCITLSIQSLYMFTSFFRANMGIEVLISVPTEMQRIFDISRIIFKCLFNLISDFFQQFGAFIILHG